MLRTSGFLLLALVSGPALAEPLALGAINGTDNLSRSPEIARCEPGADTCVLTRTSFGGLAVSRSAMILNPAGRVRSVDIVLAYEDFEPARQLLIGRYGRPADGRARWTAFDDRAAVAIRNNGSDTVISFDFPANAVAASQPLDRAVWPWLALVGLGLPIGVGAYSFLDRARTATPRPDPHPAAPVSMRATLERKLRQGEEMSF